MSSKSLPPRPNIEQYRKQAKELLRSFAAGEPAVRQRVRDSHPGASELEADPTAFSLSDAQWVIAREHGFDSWPKFVRHIQALASSDYGLVASRSLLLRIESAEVYAACFSRDGSRVLVGAAGTQVGLWDTTSGECLRVLSPSSRQAYALDWVEESQHALVGEPDGTVGLWNVEKGTRRWEMVGHRGEVRCVDVSPDLTCAASGCSRRDLGIGIWDVESGNASQRLVGHRDGVYTVSLNANQDRLLSGSRDATVRLWDTATGECLCVMEGHRYHVHSVDWSPDERTAASCSRSVRVWDLQSGSCLRVLEGHTDTIRSVSWSRDGRRLLSASHDGTAILWDSRSGKRLTVLRHSVGLVNAAFAMDELQVIAADWLGNICAWVLT